MVVRYYPVRRWVASESHAGGAFLQGPLVGSQPVQLWPRPAGRCGGFTRLKTKKERQDYEDNAAL